MSSPNHYSNFHVIEVEFLVNSIWTTFKIYKGKSKDGQKKFLHVMISQMEKI